MAFGMTDGFRIMAGPFTRRSYGGLTPYMAGPVIWRPYFAWVS